MHHFFIPGVLGLFLSTLSGVPAIAQVFASLEEIDTPATPSAENPSLAIMPDGRVLMSWVQTDGPVYGSVRTAVFDGSEWSGPVVVAEGDDLFINYADFPSVAAMPDGTLAINWMRANGDSYFAYDTYISLSHDDGATWDAGIVPHRDGTVRQHGFVSMVPAFKDSGAYDGVMAMWLDGRNHEISDSQRAAEAKGDAMQLRATTIGRDGELSEEILLDPRTCTCCQTSAVSLDDGTVLLAYRDRTEDEIRDISLVRQVDGAWSDPLGVSGDGWNISGCPVNGPAIDAQGSRVALVWFTAANGIPAVRMAFSDDRGANFGKPKGIDLGSPFGGVDVVQLLDGSALFSWVERTAAGEVVLVCRATPTNGCGTPVALTLVSTGRTIGFPRMVASGADVWIAWNETSEAGGQAAGAMILRLAQAKVDLAQ
ncbi:glycoside hydrolase [Roseivivax sp. GX 12232]|uniref:sialidase family protein n=1 Tax=Roseivivax sp. GX 12232 TaxID=2900547 RepID=UPI001E28E940|nr:sialidase family protein [Roseivivax sp. GX 12232]MCE0507327.1 glycoside hydrolase [Roseivivax sp. GX 12232]